MKKHYIYIIVIAFFYSLNNLNAQMVSADCSTVTPICDNTGSGGQVQGSGQDDFNGSGSSGCLQDGGAGTGIESNSAWYSFGVTQDGQLGFDIDPQNNAEDWDFALYGPFSSPDGNCNNIATATPIRCNYDPNGGTDGYTGVGENPVNPANGIAYDSFLNATAGEFYVLLVNNFSNTNSGFNIVFTGDLFDSGNEPLDCSIVNPITFCEGDVESLDATTPGAVTYSWTQDGNPLAETGPILNNVVAPSATYIVEAINAAGNVISEIQFNVNFSNTPTVNSVDSQFRCDDNNDGFFDFDFTTLDATIIGTQTDVEVSYHNTLNDAQTDMSPITGLYPNATAYTLETIFIRVENTTNRDCASTGSFDINVFNTPIANIVDNQLVCDDNNDGFWDFDLDALRSIALGTQDPMDYNVSFHLEQSDAMMSSATNPLPNNFTNLVAYGDDTIWVRVENISNPDADICFDITSFNIDVFDQPTAEIVPSQLICDDDNDGFWDFDLDALRPIALGTQDPTQFEVSFHLEQADAMMSSLTNPLPNTFTNLVAYQDDIIYVRVENVDNTNCFEISQFIIDVFDQPTPSAYIYRVCDDDADGDDTNGFVDFPLAPTDIDSFILNGQDPMQFTVSYHLNQTDADNDSGAITNLYTDDRQIIARVENNDNTLCYETVVVDLEVNALPVITDMVSLLQCDTDTDGISDFNLTESEVLISSDPTQQTFTYHTSFADADMAGSPIPNVTAYTNTDPSSNPDVLFVRVENADGCHRVAQLDLFVSTTSIPPGFLIPTYQECDDTRVDANITDGITTFDFSDATPQIVGLFPAGQVITVTYYETTADALAEINAIPDISNHINTASPFNQTITYRIDSDVDNSCLGLGEFELETINPMPNLNPDPIILCDDVTVGDLVETFDLTQREAFIFNGETNVSATYHSNYNSAVAGSDAIPTPTAYDNTNPSETIFVRVTNTDNCFAIVELDILVNPLPNDDVMVTDFFECENNTDFFFDFDLESKTTEILNGQDPMLFTVTYHENQLDADNLADALVSPYTNTSSPQPIYVAITNNLTGCSISTISFNIEINEGAEAVDDFYEECDVVNDNDGFTQFDLASRSPIILDGQDPLAFSISYHFSFDDAFNNVDPLPLLYENFTVNTQVIYARVSNVIRPTECFAISEVTLQVNLLPIFDLEDKYILCFPNNDEAVVDVPPILDTGLPASDYNFVWSLDGVVLPTETGSSLIPTVGGIYDVVVTDTSTSTVTMCQNFDSAEVIESGIPDNFTVDVTSQAFNGNNMIVATATGNGEYEYSLDNGPWQLDNNFENVTGGQHTVYARDILGCGIISEIVTVIDYPKFFTPNGDGNNDTWTIKGIDSQPSAIIYIHDRFGKLIKQLSPTSPGWDGTFNGNRMPSSDYWFTLEYNEPINDERRTFTAHFALKR